MGKEILEALQLRYATKIFDATKKLTEQQISIILDAVRLTPTSYGLQLMKVVVVENAEKRAQLLTHSFGQKQVVDASHLLILCREKSVDESHVMDYITNISNTRKVPKENLAGFENMMLNSIAGMTDEAKVVWMEKQVYIALGNLLNTCAMLNIDACPMEGFNAKEYAKVLNLDTLNLSPVLTIPIGYRSAEDNNAKNKKVRRSIENFVVRM